MKKILFVSEFLNFPYDEGIKKTVYNLFLELDKKYNLKVICRYGFNRENIHIVKTNPLFLDIKTQRIIKKFSPDILIYFPFASMTFAGYLRLFVLKKFVGNIKSIVIALQPKKLSLIQEKIAKYIKPAFALTPSPELKKKWDSFGFKSKLLPLYTNLSVFKPLGNKLIKIELRKKYGIPVNKFIISHIGHLNEGRNLRSLIPLQKAGYQVIVVGSSSTPKDSLGPESLKHNLQKEGVIILDGYIEKIEEVYQLSDLYVFPVVAKNSSIGMPLSVLEARACGIPVMTTNFGSLKEKLGFDNSILFCKPVAFLDTVKKNIEFIKNNNHSLNHIEMINEEFNNIISSLI